MISEQLGDVPYNRGVDRPQHLIVAEALICAQDRALAAFARARCDRVVDEALDRSSERQSVGRLELDYVFGWPGGMFSKLFPDAEHPPTSAMISLIQGYWTSFARTGKPSGSIAWPRYQQADDTHLRLDHKPSHASGLAREACDIVDSSPGFDLLAL